MAYTSIIPVHRLDNAIHYALDEKNVPVSKTKNRWKANLIRLSIKTSQNRICSSLP